MRALANSAGSITGTYRYDAYGNQTSSSGTTPNPYRYAGQRLDDGTGLYQLRARSYDPGTGRFLSWDTAGVDVSDPAQLNRYVYAQDDPTDLTDPSGYGPLADLAAELGTIGRAAVTLVVLAPVYVIQDLYELGLLGEVLSLIARIHELCDFTLHNAEFIAGMLTGLSGGIPSGSGGPPPAPGPVPGAGGIPAATPGCGGVSAVTPTDIQAFQITAAGWGATFSGTTYPLNTVGWHNIPNANPVPRPCGPFKLLVDPDHSRARSLWDNESANYKAANSIPRFDNNIPIEIHHIQPIKFGGDPVDSSNLVPLLHPDHSPFTTWWGGLQADLERTRGIYPPNDPNAPITFLNPGGHL